MNVHTDSEMQANCKSMKETLYLLSSRANADRLMASIAEYEAGSLVEVELDENGEYEEKIIE